MGDAFPGFRQRYCEAKKSTRFCITARRQDPREPNAKSNFFIDKDTPREYTFFMNVDKKKKLVGRLSRIEGQIRGLKRMVLDENYCMEILQQMLSVRGALKSAGLMVLENHLETCVKSAMRSEDDEASTCKISELVDIYRRLGM